MPGYIIQSCYHLPVFRVCVYHAGSPDAACRVALDDSGWTSTAGAAGKIHVSNIWEGEDQDHRGPQLAVPSQFDDPVQRRSRHFEILLGLLKIFFDDAQGARPPSSDWLARSSRAITRGEAILAGRPDPEEPVDAPKPADGLKPVHVLARLQEDRVRDAITAILDVDPDFSGIPAGQVTDDDIHAACLVTIATLSFVDEIGNAEFFAAMTVLRSMRACRLQQ